MSGALSHSPAVVVAKLLVDLALGAASGQTWPVFTSEEPDGVGVPDAVITTYDTSGTSSGKTHADNERQEHHGVQVRIRSSTHDVGYTKARAIATALDAVNNATVGVDSSSYNVVATTRTSDVLSLGRETPVSNRRLFTVNFLVALTQLD